MRGKKAKSLRDVQPDRPNPGRKSGGADKPVVPKGERRKFIYPDLARAAHRAYERNTGRSLRGKNLTHVVLARKKEQADA